MSMSETAAQVNVANVNTAEAKANIMVAQESIQKAMAGLVEVMGDAQPARLVEYLGALHNAIATTDRAMVFLDGGMESGEAYIVQLYS